MYQLMFVQEFHFLHCNLVLMLQLLLCTYYILEHALVLQGAPVSDLLRHYNTTVTVCHSKTMDLAQQAYRADILIVAARQPGMVKKHWVKPGAIVIDVGINSIPGEDAD